MTNYTFQSLFDFTRTTSGTFVGSDGLIQTTPASVNLLTFTQQFDNAAWTKGGSTITANSTVAPDGTSTADTLVENTASSFRAAQASFTFVAGVSYSLSVYAKQGSGSRVLQLYPSFAQGGNSGAAFNLSNGTVVTTAGTGSGVGSITPVGNGWYRCGFTFVCQLSGANSVFVGMAPTTADAMNFVYTGDGTSGIFIWGAQLEVGSTATEYTRNNGGVYPARFDYDPATLAPKGILIEEQRTNLMFPANGTTGWQSSPSGSVTATANSIISPDGTTNATKLSMGDLSNTGHTWFKTYAGAVNTTYVGSVYLKAGEYTRSQVTFGNTAFASTTGAIFDLSNGTVVVTAGGSTATITAVGNGWYRCTVTATTDADGGNYVFGASPKPASVTTIDATFTPASVGLGGYVYGIQVEAGAFATSLIPTVASQVTRTADQCSIVAPMFAPWYNQSEGTIVVKSSNFSTANFPCVVAINDATSSNRINAISSTTTANRVTVTSGGVVQAEFSFSNYVTNTIVSQALAIKANDFAGSVNGATVLTDTSGTVPTVTQMQLGAQTGGLNPLNGHIRSIQYYPTRITDAQLQALTQ